MKKIIYFALISMLLFAGCSKSNKNNIVEKLDKKISELSSYNIRGLLSISNNEDTYNYDIDNTVAVHDLRTQPDAR